MKKIPTLFERVYENHKVVDTLNKITPGCEGLLEDEENVRFTVKYDGSCCALINGVFYKRFDAKKGRNIPDDAIPCCDPDPVTGHWPHWVKVKTDNPADKWFIEALQYTLDNYIFYLPDNTTFEAVGKHFQGNPYNFDHDELMVHGDDVIKDCPRTFEGIKQYLKDHYIEGIVLWKENKPVAKIKRVDFGYEWNNSTEHKH